MFSKNLFVLVLVLCAYVTQAQRTVDTTYYTDWTFFKKKKNNKTSKYAKIIVEDGNFHSETQMNISSGQLYVYKAYNGDEPVGKWKRLTSVEGLEEKNYDFELEYTSQFPPGIKGKNPIRALLFDIASIGYEKPLLYIKNQPKDFRKVFRRTFSTPRVIRAKSYSGGYVIEVDVKFRLNENGDIEQVSILRGQNPIVDKEIARTIRAMKFQKPATINGKPIAADFVYRVRMQIRPNAA